MSFDAFDDWAFSRLAGVRLFLQSLLQIGSSGIAAWWYD